MSIHVEPVAFTIRSFASGKQWGDEFKAVLTIQKMGDIGYCSGCLGEFSVADYRQLERKMRKHGIQKLKWHRPDGKVRR